MRFGVYQLAYVRGVFRHKIRTYAGSEQQQRYNCRNSVSSSCLVPLVTVCVVGAQQEIEPRQQSHDQCNNHTHMVIPHTRYTKHTAVAKVVVHISSRFLALLAFIRNGPHACQVSLGRLCVPALIHIIGPNTYHWEGCVFPLSDLRRPRAIKLTPSRREALFSIQYARYPPPPTFMYTTVVQQPSSQRSTSTEGEGESSQSDVNLTQPSNVPQTKTNQCPGGDLGDGILASQGFSG